MAGGAVGGFCVGHAVIVGIDTQAQLGGDLWSTAPQCLPLKVDPNEG
jgi:hypothetical protein